MCKSLMTFYQIPFARRRPYDGLPLFRSRPTADPEGNKTESTLHFAPDVLAPTITKRI